MIKSLLVMILALGLFGSVQMAQTMDDPIPHCFPCDD
jgi:hypothetical protein